MSFYINAYNIFAIHLVLSEWPVESIKEVGPFYLPVWRVKAGQLDHTPVTLHHIEHQVLRPMKDPRIHMAIVCASISCPDLRNEAYTAAALDQQLDDQTERFLKNPEKGIRLSEGHISLSKIFSWFEDDFQDFDGPLGFISNYIELPLIEQPLHTVEYMFLDYDWKLNGD